MGTWCAGPILDPCARDACVCARHCSCGPVPLFPPAAKVGDRWNKILPAHMENTVFSNIVRYYLALLQMGNASLCLENYFTSIEAFEVERSNFSCVSVKLFHILLRVFLGVKIEKLHGEWRISIVGCAGCAGGWCFVLWQRIASYLFNWNIWVHWRPRYTGLCCIARGNTDRELIPTWPGLNNLMQIFPHSVYDWA